MRGGGHQEAHPPQIKVKIPKGKNPMPSVFIRYSNQQQSLVLIRGTGRGLNWETTESIPFLSRRQVQAMKQCEVKQ